MFFEGIQGGLGGSNAEKTPEEKKAAERMKNLSLEGQPGLDEAVRNAVVAGSVVYNPGNNGQMDAINHSLLMNISTLDVSTGGKVTIYQLLAKYKTLFRGDLKDKIRHFTPFAGPGQRSGEENVNNGGIEWAQMNLSEVPTLHLENPESDLCPTVAIVQVSKPDENGNFSLAEGGIAISAIRGVKAKGGKVIAVVNEHAPQFSGSCFIKEEDMDYRVKLDEPISFHGQEAPPQEWEQKIAENIVSLLRDGDILQLGIGSIPPLVLRGIKEKGLKDIKIFSEVLMINKDLRDLVEAGIITGVMKCGIPLFASQEDVEWAQKNKGIIQVEPQKDMNSRGKMEEVKKTGRLVSINAGLCASVDGAVAAHTIGKDGEEVVWSGVGGALDFHTGADISIVAIAATRPLKDKLSGATKDVSNIDIRLPEGAVTTYSPQFTGFLVTDEGIARIKGASDQERLLATLAVSTEEEAKRIATNIAGRTGPYTHLVATAEKYLANPEEYRRRARRENFEQKPKKVQREELPLAA